MDDEHVRRLDLEERRGSADRAAGVVHVRLRLEQDELAPVDVDLGQPAAELRLPRAGVPTRELVHDHVAGVVPVPRVLAARIAQARDEEDDLALGAVF